MKIAISGTHCSGKTSLIEELSRELVTYEVVEEPYYLLEDEGSQFADTPCLEDFELQLDRSIQCIAGTRGDGLFERCPVDFLAYLLAHRDVMNLDVAGWLPRMPPATGSLYIGGPEPVARKIAARVRALGASRFDLKYSAGTLRHELMLRSIELYGREVIPRVRQLLTETSAVTVGGGVVGLEA
jgi:hypothetical protein